MNSKRILVEIDSLLDTRLGTLDIIDGDIPEVVLKNGYYSRYIDDWDNLSKGKTTKETFNNHYHDRTTFTLNRSRITGVCRLIYTLSEEASLNALHDPESDSVVFDINISPYVLDEDEKEMLLLCVSNYLYAGTECRIVNVPHSELTVDKIKNNWDSLILYDFDRWFSNHGDGLTNTPIPRVLLYCPGLLIKPPETGVDPRDIFNTVEMSLVEKINVEFMPSHVFSLMQ